MNSPCRRTLLYLAASALLALPSLAQTQTQPTQGQVLQGGVQYNENAPFVDIIEAGNKDAVASPGGAIYCDWMQGACDELHAWVGMGSPNGDRCLGPLKAAVELERQQQALPLPPAITAQAYAQQFANLGTQRDHIVAGIPPDCFTPQAIPPSPPPLPGQTGTNGNGGGGNPPYNGGGSGPPGGNSGNGGNNGGPPRPNTGRRPSHPINDAGSYIQGLADGAGQCIKGFGDMLAGASAFMQGDFVHAAQLWGLSPGQSVVLKGIYSELTTPVVGSNVTPYEQGVTAGRRLCSYAVAPAIAKSVLKAGAGAKAAPVAGPDLLDATTNSPAALANKWVQLPNGGTVQLGNFVGNGTFAAVYQLGKNVIKLSTNQEGSMNAIAGQVEGAQRLQAAGVSTPTISGTGVGSAATGPSWMIASDVAQEFPGAYQLNGNAFNALSEAQRAEVTNAINNVTNKIADAGYVWPDNHFGNMMFQPVADGLNVIIHDPDMILSVPEMQQAVSQMTIPARVAYNVLNSVGQVNLLGQPFTAQSLMTALRNARFGGGVGGSTAPKP